MKNKFKSIFSEINLFVNSEKFLVIFLFIIINNVYGAMALVFSWDTYIDAFFSFFTGSYYILILQVLVLVSVNTTVKQFEKNYTLIIRFKGRKEYMKELVKRIIRNVLIVFIINLIIAILTLNLIRWYNFGVGVIEQYNISNVLYLVFYIIRFSIIILLNSLVFLYMMKSNNKSIGIVLCLVYILISFLPLRKPHYIFYFEYFNILICKAFIEELIRSVIFISIMIVLLKIFHDYTIKNMKKLVD